MSQRPDVEAWHRRSEVIFLLLLLFPPLGILLMWIRFSWARKTKQLVSVASVVWFAFVLFFPRCEESDETAEASTQANEPAVVRGVRVEPLPVPETGTTMIEDAPQLLAPMALDGFALASVRVHQECCGLKAQYVSLHPATTRLTPTIAFIKSNEPLPTLGKTSTVTQVGEYVAILDDEREFKSVTMQWSMGAWVVIVSVEYERASDGATARDAAKQIAPQLAAKLEQYLTGTPPPRRDREQHIASVAKLNATADAVANDSRRKNSLQSFVQKLRDADVSSALIVTAELDPLGQVDVILTVGPQWHRTVRQERLQLAQSLWETWARIASPRDLDNAHIKLVDRRGNKIGGSGVMGSSIELD